MSGAPYMPPEPSDRNVQYVVTYPDDPARRRVMYNDGTWISGVDLVVETDDKYIIRSKAENGRLKELTIIDSRESLQHIIMKEKVLMEIQ